MTGKQRENGHLNCLQIKPWRDLITRSLTRDAERLEQKHRDEGTPLVAEAEVSFLKAAVTEISNYTTTSVADTDPRRR